MKLLTEEKLLNKICLLDCTLRDGGYINNFDFGNDNITKIINNLYQSGLDIVECGFLQKDKDDPNKSLFKNTAAIAGHLPQNRKNDTMFVAMIAYGDIPIEDIEPYDGTSISGIRLTFHEHVADEAVAFAQQLKEKGYNVFFQPVGTTSYTDRALLDLIDKVNKLHPFAFYLVDTLGAMYKNDLLRMFYLVDNNLYEDIRIGFHSHNNLQLSFSNAQELILMRSKRKIVIDTSVYGMGRGAGNLCTELLAQYINKNIENRYDLIPILECVDEFIIPIFMRHTWGYSVPYYLAAVNGCHPNYATYLVDRQTLCVRDINAVIKAIPTEQRALFNKELIQKLYIEYLQRHIDDTVALSRIKQLCDGKEVLLLAPGKSLNTYKEKITSFIKNHNPIVFAINHVPMDCFRYDRIFIGNVKRFKGVEESLDKLEDKVVCTSNVTTDETLCVLNFSSYLNNDQAIVDNSGLMLINILKKAGVKKIELAGFDGFELDMRDNYFNDSVVGSVEYENQKALNAAMINYFKNLGGSIDLTFLTPTIYDGKKYE